MIVALSTSSSLASVAILQPHGVLVDSAERLAPMTHSHAILELLSDLMKTHGLSWAQVSGFVADVGPGSFTGIKVGVTITKTLGFATGTSVAGVSAFDLIADGIVVVPARRNEFWIREPGQHPRLGALPNDALGYGEGIPSPHYPRASRISGLLSSLDWVGTEALTPEYGLEPSISQPKRPLGIAHPSDL